MIARERAWPSAGRFSCHPQGPTGNITAWRATFELVSRRVRDLLELRADEDAYAGRRDATAPLPAARGNSTHSVVVECLKVAGSGVRLGRVSVEQSAAGRRSENSVGAGHEGDRSVILHGDSPGDTGATVDAGEAVTAPVT